MYIRKARAGSVPGHTWGKDGEVVEVEDCFGEELLLIPNGGFSIAEAPKEPEPAPFEEPETQQEFDEVLDKEEPVEVDAEPEEATEQRKGPGRPKLPRDARGNVIRK
jgi:hypothetical protein